MADIEAKIKGLNKNEKTQYLKTLTAEDILRYNRYRNNERQKKYKENTEKKALANERSRLIMFKNREDDPEKYKALNRKHNKDYNDRQNKAFNEMKAKQILRDAIKANKARAEMNKLKEEKVLRIKKNDEREIGAKQTLTNVIKAKKARAELRENTVKKAEETVKVLDKKQMEIKKLINEAKANTNAVKKIDIKRFKGTNDEREAKGGNIKPTRGRPRKGK